MKLKSPEQICRFDGKNVFVEVLTSAMHMDKILLNFCQYDTSKAKGSRLESLAIYVDIQQAALLAEDILNGELARKAEKEKQIAASKGSKYPGNVWGIMGGNSETSAKRPDGKAESRQLQIFPGMKQPWVFTASKGPGHSDAKGLIVPEYTTAKADAVIRVPMTNDSIKVFALTLRELHGLWLEVKFKNVINDGAPIPLQTPMFAKFNQEKESPDLIPNETMRLYVDSLTIDKLAIGFEIGTQGMLKCYLDILTAQLWAQDILSGRVAKLASKKITEPVLHYMGGKAKPAVISRQVKIYGTEDGFIIEALSGPGKLNETGLIVPCYDDSTAKEKHRIFLTPDSFRVFAISIQNLGRLWTVQKFGPVIQGPIDRKRQEILDAIKEKK